METTDCCALLLRGGKSRRMGTDKALLLWNGRTYLQTIAEKMDRLFTEKYLSVAAEWAVDLAKEESPEKEKTAETLRAGISRDWVLLPDAVPDCGPLGGIRTALQTCRADWVFVSPCDTPFVEISLYRRLLENRAPDVDIVYPVTPDGMHLTFALYRKTLAPVAGQMIGERSCRLSLLLERCRAKPVYLTDPESIHMLTNINTQEDRAREEERDESRECTKGPGA